MKFIKIVILVVLVYFAGLGLASLFLQNKSQEQPKQAERITNSSMKVISWIPYWDQKNAFASFERNPKAFDFLSMFWYRIDANGNLTKYKVTNEDLSLVRKAQDHGVKVMALVANMPDYDEKIEDWDPDRVNKVIATASARKKHIADLVNLVKSKNFDGLDIDYEALRADQREDFSVFIEELAAALHKEKKYLGIGIHPKTAENKPEEDNGSHAQDLPRLAKVADNLYFMTYLEHGKFSDPGSIASLPWMKEIMTYAVHELEIPKEKIFLGIGLFGVNWRKNNNGTYEPIRDDITFGEIEKIISDSDAEIHWDITAKSPYIEYTDSGAEYVLWFENADSIKHRLRLAENYGVGGLALWRLNNEDGKVWEFIR